MGRSLKSRRYIEVTHTGIESTRTFLRSIDNTKKYLLDPVAPIDLGSLKNCDKRAKDRVPTGGVVIIHDLQRKRQYKVNIKNLSIGGLCCEIETDSVFMGTEIMVEFVGSISKAGLDVVKSKVMWIVPIANRSNNTALIGLGFAHDLNKTKIKKISDYVDILKSEVA